MSTRKDSSRVLLSIVTVVKNDSIGFLETLESFKCQNLSNVEWVVIDSSKGSEIQEILATNKDFEGRYIYKWCEARGIYPAMNKGIEIAHGEWIWFLNAGDRLSDQVNMVELKKTLQFNPKVDAVSYSVLHEIASGYPWSISTPKIVELPHKIIIDCNHQGFVARKTSLVQLGGFDEKYKFAADSKLMDSFASTQKIHIDSMVLSHFTIGGTSTLNYKKVIAEINDHRFLNLGCKEMIKEYRYVLQTFVRRSLIKVFPLLPQPVRRLMVGKRVPN